MYPSTTFADPTAAAQGANSLNATQTASWLNTGATALSTIAMATAGGYQSTIASNNAALAEADAANATSAGNYSAEINNLNTGAKVAKEKVSQAANNIDVNVGSAQDVRDATQKIGDLDTAMIHYNAARAAYGYGQQASNYRTQAGLDKMATGLNLIGGSAKTYSSYLAGAQALASNKLKFAQAGVPN